MAWAEEVEFTRSGSDRPAGRRRRHFDLQATLGFLLGAFARTIEGEMINNLDQMLAKNDNQPAAN